MDQNTDTVPPPYYTAYLPYIIETVVPYIIETVSAHPT